MSKLARLPETELRSFATKVLLLCDLLHGPVADEAQSGSPPPVPPPDEVSLPSVPTQSGREKGLLPLPAMRPPAPGSIRADVHDILRSAGKPMRRFEILSAVASRRGVPISDTMKASVGDALKGGRDPSVKRLATGIYEFCGPS